MRSRPMPTLNADQYEYLQGIMADKLIAKWNRDTRVSASAVSGEEWFRLQKCYFVVCDKLRELRPNSWA